MKDQPLDPKLQEMVRASIRPAERGLQRDLWPQMHARLLGETKKPSTIRRFRLKLQWWEWGLAVGDISIAFYAPDAIPALLYHL